MKSTIVMTESVNAALGSVALNAELEVDVQYALDDCNSIDSDDEEPPGQGALSQWAKTAFVAVSSEGSPSADIATKYPFEVTIRIVGDAEMRELNHQYRGKDQTTNVLSFSFEQEFEAADEMDVNLLGDIVICHSVVAAQAKQQDKTIQDHYAHMVTHGILHLCGYDHETEQEAEQMEAIEVTILAQSDISNPYTLSSDLS